MTFAWYAHLRTWPNPGGRGLVSWGIALAELLLLQVPANRIGYAGYSPASSRSARGHHPGGLRAVQHPTTWASPSWTLVGGLVPDGAVLHLRS